MQDSDQRIYDLTRRKVLGGLTAVGLGAAGAGIGTSAYFSDEEVFKNNRLVAGELDLLVDFQEHYSDWSTDEAEAVSDIRMPTEGTFTEADYPSDYTGLPAANDAMIAVPTADVAAFIDTTAIDAFPDTDDDAIQEPIPVSNECGFLRQEGYLRNEGEFVSALDSPARTADHQGDPLVSLSDVKPGDFGEVTFSLHLCDNPGYLWMSGELVENDEVRVTEPEADSPNESQNADDPDDDFDGELAQNIQAAAWYDTGENGTFFETEDPDTEPDDEGEGDNIWQDFDDDSSEDPQPDAPERLIAKGSLIDVLAVLNREPGLPLDAEPSTVAGGTEDPPSGPTTDPDSGGTISGLAESSDYLCCTTVGGNPKCSDLGFFSALKLDEGDDLPASDTLPQDFQTPAGIVTIEDYDVGAGTVTISTDFGAAAVVTKGGPNARVCYGNADGDATIEEGDAVQLTEVTFQTPDNPNSGKPYGLSHVQVCYRADNGDDPRVPPLENGDRECFPASDTAYIGFAWWLPIEVGNEVQADSLAFDLGFYAEQCRHNDGSGMEPEE